MQRAPHRRLRRDAMPCRSRSTSSVLISLPDPATCSGKRLMPSSPAATTAAGGATSHGTGRSCRSAVIHKLDHIEILMSAGRVCRSWLCAARDEPELWRRMNMLFHAELHFEVGLHGMAAAAVRRSAGQREAFWGEHAGDDRFILYLADIKRIWILEYSSVPAVYHKFNSKLCCLLRCNLQSPLHQGLN